MSFVSDPDFPVRIPLHSRPFGQHLDTLPETAACSWDATASTIQSLGLNLSGSELAAVALLQDTLLDALRSPTGQGMSVPNLATEALHLHWRFQSDIAAEEAGVLLLALQQNTALERCEALLGLSPLQSLNNLMPSGHKTPLANNVGGALLPWLTEPFRLAGESLRDQLRWILENWSDLLSEGRQQQLLRALDLLEEYHRNRGGGHGPSHTFGLASEHDDGSSNTAGQDRYSDDADWMTQMVLVAKQTLVWLDQLSNEYGRSIQRLDEIPTEALQELLDRGFRGLWLIGLWERSPASKKIKQIRGNSEAEASAYALMDYDIAESLGGEEAYLELKQRADAVGLRLAADMVPNHTGIDSAWMRSHPERFVQLETLPYPDYRFDGPDLSSDPTMSVHLEDGYWQESDAAVVFRRVDRQTGATRYIYHGNDGTQMPWNDTAQLDFLQPEVREAVIQSILRVARRFPVIRFDAAMTLARQHIQRLWHPLPGDGGAIPSRAAHGVDPQTFDAHVPGEFWHEVVERIQKEVPDTLLLAEAFWMMEGYFVRELGMHRVYNSAFMHMLRDEDNAEYRQGIKEILATNPGILERFVNFMNNPDEETAAAQFGTGDKYFGIATLMATLPGLPLFGHGQFEGYREKYGMEFRRAYGGEQVDGGLLDHHLRVITPLLKERHRFAGVHHFRLFDWNLDQGGVNENVFAYTNRSPLDGGGSFVIYNNAYETTAGTLQWSAPVPNSEGELESTELLDALGCDHDRFCAFYNPRQDAWLISEQTKVSDHGLSFELQGYEVLIFNRVETLNKLPSGWQDRLDRDGSIWVSDRDLREHKGSQKSWEYSHRA